MGLTSSLLVTANRLFCLMRLKRHSTALALADNVIGVINSHNAESAYLWSPDSFALEWVSDIRVYIIDLTERIVRHSSEGGLIEQWKPLLDEARAAVNRA
jgi:hypothetical protein